MSQTIVCPNVSCGRPLRLEVAPAAGSTVTCPECGQSFALPASTLSMAEPGDVGLAAEGETAFYAHASSESLLANRNWETPKLLAKIGRFEIRLKLGEGAFGKVYEAYDPQLDRTVAIKVAKLGRGDSEQRVKRFLREAKTAANLRHPHIVPIHEFGQEGDQFYIVSAFIKGRTLKDVLKERRAPDLNEAVAIVRKLAEALAYAHREGIVHRDVKPANVMIDEKNEPLLMDFGLATRAEEAEKLTHEGAILGTPLYMSPEQAKGEGGPAVAASDQYSLGVMLYEMIAGEPPFAGTPQIVMFHHMTEDPPSPRNKNAAISRDLETLCLKCLEKEPGRRYVDEQMLAEDLRRWQEGEPITARRLGFWERTATWARRRPAAAGLLAVSLVAALVLLVVTAWAVRETERRNVQLTRAEWLLYGNQIRAAQREWEVGNAALAWHHWGLCREDFRGWEHRYLFTLFNSNQVTFRGHGGSVMAISRDGKHIASGDGDPGVVKIWDADTGAEVLSLAEHTLPVTSVAFSPDGKRIVSSSRDGSAAPANARPGELKVWDAENGKRLLDLKGPPRGFFCVAYSPDGKRIASASGDPGEVKVWDADTGIKLLSFRGGFDIHGVAFSPDGKRIASVSQGVTVWDAEKGIEIMNLHALREDGVGDATLRNVAFSPDGKRIASAGSGPVFVWDADKGNQLLALKGHTSFVTSVAFSPDSKRIVSGSDDMTVKVWDVDKGTEVLSLKGHTRAVASVAFHPDNKRILSGSNDGTVKVWDTQKSQEPRTLKGHNNVAITPDGNRIACSWAAWDNTLKILDADKGTVLVTLKGDDHRHLNFRSLACSPDGKRLASASTDDTVSLWDAVTGQELSSFREVSFSVGFSADGKRFASGGNGLKIRDAHSGQELSSVSVQDTTGYVTCFVFSPDGKRIASNVSFGVKVWDADKGTEIVACGTHTAAVLCVAYSPDGSRIASASIDQTVKIWDAHRGTELLSLQGHTVEVRSVAFSPDGKRMVSGSVDKTVKVWDASTGQETITLTGHTDGVASVAFRADGKQIVSASGNGTIKVWDASLQKTK